MAFKLDHTSTLTRRQFLQLAGLGAVGWMLGVQRVQAASLEDQHGRVTAEKIDLHAAPDLGSQVTGYYWKDVVLPITHVTIGAPEPTHNRVWYAVGDLGFVHSGSIQPVQTRFNIPLEEIPRGGVLGEISVPYTDARYTPDIEGLFAYRLYYETTHWITGIVDGTDGRKWYRILEDKWDLVYYIPAHHVYIHTVDDVSPISPGLPLEAKRIEVDLINQIVTAYEWNRPVFRTKAATGSVFRNGKFSTPEGRHTTYHKRPSRHMAAGDLAANGYDLPGVPWVSYITESGVAFHGAYWHNDFGRPRSHGCINLPSQASRWLYRWTLPSVPHAQQRVVEDFGTRVDIFAV